MERVTGIVEAVGDKYNGSLKVNGKWLNNHKGFKNPAKVGDQVTLTLKSWSFGGKSGVNIVAVDVLAVPVEREEVEKSEIKERLEIMNAPFSKNVLPDPVMPKGRDFDKEARGKTFCSYLTALLGNPGVVNTLGVDLEKLFDIAQNATDRTFEK